MIREILVKGKRGFGKTVFDHDPKELVAKVVSLIARQELENHNGHSKSSVHDLSLL
jgi:hypothetical protein